MTMDWSSQFFVELIEPMTFKWAIVKSKTLSTYWFEIEIRDS